MLINCVCVGGGGEVLLQLWSQVLSLPIEFNENNIHS